MSEEPYTAPNQGGAPANQILVSGRYEIHPDKPLPDLDSPLAHAVEATDQRARTRGMFALVCRLELMPRVDIIPPLSRLVRMPLLVPVDAGVVPWRETDGRRFVIVFESMVGERVMPTSSESMTPLREDTLIRTVITPLLPVLKEMNGRLICHRAIRADNLFYADSSKQSVTLGECVSAPPGISQPVIYETVPAAMTNPEGRGERQPADDLYAFGVALIVLLCGGNPVADLSDEEIIAAKITHGSYAALLRQTRVSLKLMEPLRGLLYDNPAERWTATDIELWLEGRQLSPKQPALPDKALRSIVFAGQEYWTKPSLAYAMGRNWDQAGKIIVSGELEGWIRRSYSDDDLADGVCQAASGGSAGSGEDRLISRTLMLLDPDMPIRYREFSALPNGLAQAFAIDYQDPEKHKLFAQVVAAKLPQAWLQTQTKPRPEHGSMMKSFDMINYFMDRPQLGSGLERALYESNPGWPCQSPLVREDYVSEIEELLPALDRRIKNTAPDEEPVDAHIVAFCTAAIKPFPDRILKALQDRSDLAARRLGMLRMLAEIQRNSGSNKYPALTARMASLLTPAIETYHNRSYRARLAKEIEQAAPKGDLRELLFLVDSLEARTQDARGFEQARAEYRGHARGIAWLKSGGLTDRKHVLKKSQQAATIASAVLSGLTGVFLTAIYVF